MELQREDIVNIKALNKRMEEPEVLDNIIHLINKLTDEIRSTDWTEARLTASEIYYYTVHNETLHNLYIQNKKYYHEKSLEENEEL